VASQESGTIHQHTYFAALSEQVKALVGLEQAAAIWDIEF
jgi:hypothetical protein